VITPRDVVRFTEGDCHILARAIHKRTGWDVAALHGGNRSYPDYHVFVLAPTQPVRALDVLGLHKPHELVRAYGAVGYMRVSPKSVAAAWGGPYFGRYSYERAATIADRLLAHHAHELSYEQPG